MTATIDVTALPPSAYTDAPAPDQLGRGLLDTIAEAITNHPRSQQVRIGPSEIGVPCARRIGYKLLEQPERPGKPNWKATVGTAIHAWLEDVFDTQNLTFDAQHGHHGAERWLIETTVHVGDMGDTAITGSADLFDRVTGTVIDWKSVGPTQLKKYKAHGPGAQYETQAHLYGRGMVAAGMTVRNVMIVFLPRNGELADTYIWHAPYDEQVALDALSRLSGIHLTTQALGPQALTSLPTADAYCTFCPFYKAGSTDLTEGCPGHPRQQHTSAGSDQILGLI